MFPEGQEEVRLSGPSLYLKESSCTASFDLLAIELSQGAGSLRVKGGLSRSSTFTFPKVFCFSSQAGGVLRKANVNKILWPARPGDTNYFSTSVQPVSPHCPPKGGVLNVPCLSTWQH